MNDFFDDMCYKLSPNPNRSLATKGYSKFDNKTLIFDNCDNHYFSVKIDKLDDNAVLTRLVVYGGNIWNGAESTLSQFISRNSDTLEEIIYTPGDTKGGSMIRPHYYKCNRDASLLFKNLKSVTLNCVGVPTFLDTYIAPNLETVNIVIALRSINQNDYEVIRLRLIDKFPTLKNVIFCTRTNDEINPIKV